MSVCLYFLHWLGDSGCGLDYPAGTWSLPDVSIGSQVVLEALEDDSHLGARTVGKPGRAVLESLYIYIYIYMNITILNQVGLDV